MEDTVDNSSGKTYKDVFMKRGVGWGNSPNSLCRMVTSMHLAEGMGLKRLVDIGCGAGGDLIEFAHNGFEVTGVDNSDSLLENVTKWAKLEDIKVGVYCKDLNEFSLESEFDVVYSSGSLNYMKPGKRDEIFRNYREHTSTGGINAFSVIVEKPFLDGSPHMNGEEHYFRSGELMGYYWDWDFIFTDEKITTCSTGGKQHMHATNVVIARKI